MTYNLDRVLLCHNNPNKVMAVEQLGTQTDELRKAKLSSLEERESSGEQHFVFKESWSQKIDRPLESNCR